MSIKAQITPIVLKWARETAGFSEEDIVGKLKQKTVTAEIVEQWEQGLEHPSYSQMEKLADFYKRPLAVFFFPVPPQEKNLNEKFRSVPEDYIASLSPQIRYIVRQALVKQIDLSELYQGNTPNDLQDFKNNIRSLNRQDPRWLAAQLRGIVGVSLEQQFAWNKYDEALAGWRESLQELGIWIFKGPFRDSDYCGFFLPDDNFPIIYVNNSEFKQRQIFTLFHELGHFLLGKGGIDFRENVDNSYTGEYKEEEVFCNAFAGSFLVPDNSFLGSISRNPDEKEIEDCAKKFSVSRLVIKRKCLDMGFISQDAYNKAAKESKTIQKGKSPGGGDYYANQQVYLGKKYTNLAFQQYYQGRINEYQLADYLGVKVGNISNFEGYVLNTL